MIKIVSKQFVKKLCPIILFIFFSQTVQAQQIPASVKELSTYRDSISQLLLKYSFSIKKPQRPHSLYIGLAWENCMLYSKDGIILPFVGRFNILSNLVEMKANAQQFAFNSNRIEAVYIGGRLLIPMEGVPVKGKKKNGFLEVLVSGPVNLLCFYDLNSSVENTGDLLTSSITGETRYQLNPIFFTQAEGAEIQKLSIGNQKQSEQYFKEHSDQMNAYIKTNKLRKKKQKDLVNIFNYYNQLLGQ